MVMVGSQQPCVQAYTRLVKVWKQGCSGHQWCVGYERRTTYYTGYKQMYNMQAHTAYKCCPGWSRKGGEVGCLHRGCDSETCFNGGRCTDSGEQLCHCPEGFKGPHCQYETPGGGLLVVKRLSGGKRCFEGWSHESVAAKYALCKSIW
uniref:Uncharacterized protein n=1 Tax=Knipowitschia caucasica TaxID=637954 RepID=A0AAV2J4H7_KNICA